MTVRHRLALAAAALLATALGGCGPAAVPTAHTADPTPSIDSPSPLPSPSPSSTPSRSPSPTPKRSVKPKPSKTLAKPSRTGGDLGGAKLPSPGSDGVPAQGAGTFTGAAGGTDIVGTGTTLVQYRVEVEDGINWGTIA